MSRVLPSFREACWFWHKLGWISFGGPAGQIAIMHRELVEEKKWVGEAQFLHALNFCMLLPGPEAQQLAIYLGWLLHRTWGGLVAGVLFVLPSALILWILSWIYVTHRDAFWLTGIFYGLKPAVIAIIIGATWRIGKKTLRNRWNWALAGLSLAALLWLKTPFPVLILLSGFLGWFVPGAFANEPKIETSPNLTNHIQVSWLRTWRILAIGLAAWILPLFLIGIWLGNDSTHLQMGWFFSKAALVTFGGAYAVLPYVSQQAVETFHWLQPGQMLDGLGLAETTPGPLIMVLQFVGFVGAWQHPGGLNPFWSATLGAAVTTWVTFVPCFIWIFLGAPYVELLRSRTRFSAALAAISAAVVGVMANLAFWFAWKIFLPVPGQIDWFAVALAAVALVALQKFRTNVVLVIVVAAAIGSLRFMAFPPGLVPL